MTTTSREQRKAAPPLYRHAGMVLVRAPLLPIDHLLPLAAAPVAASAPAGDAVVEQIVQDRRVQQAIFVASESLSSALINLGSAGDEERTGDAKRRRRVRSSTLRYVTRMATRATPYGLLAGVGAGRLGERTTLRLETDPLARTVTRADMAWLLDLVRQAEEGPAQLLLKVQPNPLLHLAGARAVLSHSDVFGRGGGGTVDLRVTPPVQVALDLAVDGGRTLGEVVDGVHRSVPTASREQVEGLIRRMWDLHLLVSDLRPANDVPHPEQWILDRLPEHQALVPLAQGLRRVVRGCAHVDATADPLPALRELVADQRALAPGHNGDTLRVDAALGLAADELHHSVGQETAAAADVLQRIGCFTPRLEHLEEYHHAFIERYGLHSEIPVMDVLSPDCGLDAPRGYTMPAREIPLPATSQVPAIRPYDQALVAILMESKHLGERHLELTDERVERLTVWRPGRGTVPRPALDLFVQLAASSRAAIDAGEYTLVLPPGTVADGGRAAGRFHGLLDSAANQRLARLAEAEQALEPEVVHAELCYLPPHGRSANVSRCSRLRSHQLSINTAPSVSPQFQVHLRDVLVGATADRLYLRWGATGQPLRVVQGHMLVHSTAPNACRFLLEVSDDGLCPLSGFDWGALSMVPALPRVTRGRVVLHPAQWRLTPRRLVPGVESGDDLPMGEELLAAVGEWRSIWHVPRRVLLTWLDNRLLIDLESPLYLRELRAELCRSWARGQALLLQEMLPDLSDSWLESGQGRHLSELVVPVQLDPEQAARRPPAPSVPRPGDSGSPSADLEHGSGQDEAAGADQRRALPGSRWVALRLTAAASRHEDIVAHEVPELLQALADRCAVDGWFFVRYADPYPHVRLRIRLASQDDVPSALPSALGWARQLVRSGYVSDVALMSYDRELERYGGHRGLSAVEAAFCANSEVVRELITMLAATPGAPDRDVVGVLATHQLYRAWGVDPFTTMPDRLARDLDDAARARFRARRRQLMDLLDIGVPPVDDVAAAWRPVLLEALGRQDAAVARAAGVVRDLAAEGALVGDEQTVLMSLAHMQSNRLLGMDTDKERIVHHLWSHSVSAVRRRSAARQEH